MVNIVTMGLAIATLSAHIIISIFLVSLVLVPKKALAFFHTYISPALNYVIFSSTLIATLGSLFFSEIAKFHPCDLCWYQRIFMYPQPLLTYLAILRKEKINPYLMMLNVIGVIISLYHYLLQRFPSSLPAPCNVAGGVSCIKGYTFYFGYISIPLMAFTIFFFNLLVLILNSRKR